MFVKFDMFLFCFSPFDYVVLGSKKIQTLVDELELIPADNLQVLEQQTMLEFWAKASGSLLQKLQLQATWYTSFILF